ncbi:hypothetical protein ARMA_2708 [Ardenticatena maritima]|uniref:DUF697 domain-containing protein n=1 Tax=Ardenticatena maritima TaxID=872965 RepID=A0A0M8K952_9CHLR|nr:hypothetical protein [Ardenticatena maritima]KPL87858.1 hypothetical protein SE16_09960 [Ardenticatena maritima]GAP64285.1 hypothetical protein ARMA_2708 [Ardenticatena maritima]
MSKLSFVNIVKLLREIDLESIRKEVERRFALVIFGEHTQDTIEIGRLLSGPEIHPWIDLADTTIPANVTYDLGILVTPNQKPSQAEKAAMDRLHHQKAPIIVVETPSPTVMKGIPRRGEFARVKLRRANDQEGFAEVLAPTILDARDDLLLAFGRQLDGLRPFVVQRLIEQTATTNATYALTTGLAESVPGLNVPLNVADMVVLTKNQLIMAYKIALVYGKEGDPRDLLGEILGVLGGGFFFRQLARQLVGLIPVAGIPAKTAVAYAGTYVIGEAVRRWAAGEVPMSTEELRAMFSTLVREKRLALRAPDEPLPGDEPLAQHDE